MATDQQLADVLSHFARTMATDLPIRTILDRMVESIVAVMPVASAGVTLRAADGGPPCAMAASNAAAFRFERVQAELGDGPCHEAARAGHAVAVADLERDERFRSFAAETSPAGLRAVFAFPLRHGDRGAIGALGLYQDTAGSLDEATMRAAQTLADVAAAYILGAKARQELVDMSARFQEAALHDSLTGLPNRVLFGQRMEHAVLRTRRSGRALGVLFADLDRFKEVNDLYGHAVGDELLIAVAERLTESLRPGDTLARLSGDEFVILCEDLEDPSAVERLAERIDVGMNQPFILDHLDLTVTASIGIAYSGPGGDVPEQLLTDADTAMYQAKRRGGAGHQVLDLRERERADDRATLSRDLDGVLARGELTAHYQPIVATDDCRILGVEALLRWTHPTRGDVPPALLIPLAEESNVICDIGAWIFRRACEDLGRWNHGGEPANRLGVSVNVSAHELLSGDYPGRIAAVLAETGTDPRLVTVEVTESVLIKDPSRALMVLTDLKEIGMKVALDDFGTGYSSLSYLRDFPVDVVKIDRSFVRPLGEHHDGLTIFAAIVDLAHALRKTTIAEGMETARHFRRVAELGCEACQGFYFARPMPAPDIDRLLHGGRLPVAAAMGPVPVPGSPAR